jgi:type IV secretion system protein VirB4
LPERGSSRYFDRVKALIAEGWNPVAAAVTSATTLFSDEHAFAWGANEIHYALRQFEDLLASFSQTMADLDIRRLKGKDFLGFLHKTISPGSAPDSPVSWDGQWFLDGSLPDVPVSVGDDLLKIGDADPLYATGISIKSWPEQTWAGAMDALLSVPGEMVMSHIFRVASKAETEKHISSVKHFNELLKYPLKSYLIGAFRQGSMNESSMNLARAEAVGEAQEAQAELTSGRSYWGWHNVTVLLLGDTPEQAVDLAKMAQAALQNGSLPGVVRESLHLLSAFASTMPGQWKECQRWSFLSIQNMGDIAPLRTVLKGEEVNDFLSKQTRRHCPALTVLSTEYRTPFYFNFHSGALGHTMVLGPSRSGKSVFMNFLLSQWQKYSPCRAIIFDKDMSCKISTLLHGGQHINLSSEGETIRLNPLSLVGNRQHWEFLTKWIEGLICSRGYILTAPDERAIWEALEEIAGDPDTRHWRLLTVYTQLPQHLQALLDPWVGDKPLARYFDNAEDSFSLSDFCCIEMGEIMQTPRLARSFMDYAFYRIQRMLEENRSGEIIPTIIYLEECWFLLEDPVFAARIKNWLKTLAKLTAHVVMATQSLEDIVDSGSTVFASIRDNVPTRIFLPNPYAETDSVKALYKKQFELTDDQIKLIRQGISRENYFVVKPGVARMVSCSFTPDQVAVFRSDAVAQSVFDKHYRSGKENWKERYLEEVIHV